MAVILLCFILLIGIYLYKLHALAVEGNKIFEYRCLHVNPELISYKDSFLKYADHVNNPDWASGEQMLTYLNAYVDHMRYYVVEENKWLEMDKRFIDRWDFQLIEPWYMKNAGYLQWKMYEGYRDDAVYMLSIWDHPEQARNIDPDFVSEPRQRRNKYIDEYFELFEEASALVDWRKIFGTVPVPEGCTDENMTIPNTSGSINLGNEEQESSSSGTPIDPYFTT